MFPRGGGIWEQDPILMQDFRVIQRSEREWKEAQEQIESAKNGGDGAAGGMGGLGGALDQYLEELGEDGHF
jgi:hypothetical protein